MKTMSRTIARCRVPDDPQLLHDTIVMLESRLRTLGDGDCGYEKAMIRFYEQQLVLHRARLQLHPALAGGLRPAATEAVSGMA